MQSKKLIIAAPLGIHLRPAGSLCETAIKYQSAVTIEYQAGKTANAKSMLSVLAAGIKCGDEITLICDGIDEEDALRDTLQVLMESIQK